VVEFDLANPALVLVHATTPELEETGHEKAIPL
jgi:hypothetical protein